MITKSRQAVATRRRSLLTDALPLLVLGVGLLIVLIVVDTSEQQATFARLRTEPGRRLSAADDRDAATAHRVPADRVVPTGPPQRSWALTMVFETIYLASTMAIGSRIVAAIRGDDEWPVPVRWLAGFLPGYLMVLAPLQLLFAAVPVATASWIGLAALPAWAVVLHRRDLVAGRATCGSGRQPRRNDGRGGHRADDGGDRGDPPASARRLPPHPGLDQPLPA